MDTTPESITPQLQSIIPAEKILFDSVQEYIRHFWKYLAVPAIVTIPLGMFSMWFNPFNRPWYLLITYSVIQALVLFYPKIVLLFITRKLQSNNPEKIGKACLASTSIYLPFAWTMIMVDVIYMFGAFLCCIPGVIVGVFFCVSDGIVVWEGKNGIPALKRSFELTKTHFWRVLWILGLYLLAFIILYLLLTEIPGLFIPNVPSMFKKMFKVQSWGMLAPWWFHLYRQLIVTVISPVNEIMTYILYRNLKEATEQNIEPPLNLTTPDNQLMQ
jgi:hypothetical protein